MKIQEKKRERPNGAHTPRTFTPAYSTLLRVTTEAEEGGMEGGTEGDCKGRGGTGGGGKEGRREERVSGERRETGKK